MIFLSRVPEHKNAVPYGENMCQISFIQARIIVLLVTSPMLMNQQCIFNKVSLNKNTRETKMCIDQLTKIL